MRCSAVGLRDDIDVCREQKTGFHMSLAVLGFRLVFQCDLSIHVHIACSVNDEAHLSSVTTLHVAIIFIFIFIFFVVVIVICCIGCWSIRTGITAAAVGV